MKRSPGRPPLDSSGTPSAAVCLKLRASDYDAAYKHASARREKVQDVLRRGLKRILKDERGGTL